MKTNNNDTKTIRKKESVYILLCIIGCMLSIDGAIAQAEKFKAAYLFNYTRFIEWPEEKSSGYFIFGILGPDPIIKELELLAKKKTVFGRPIKVVVFSSPVDVGSCHILFVPKEKSNLIRQLHNHRQTLAILIVTETTNGIQQGAAINFVIRDNKLLFELKESNILEHNLKVDNQLRSLAIKNYP